MRFVRTTKPKAAAAARIGAALARRKRAELLEGLRPYFARTEPWLQAGKYAAAVMSQIPRRNGWTIAAHAGDRAPDRTQRLLSRAVWDTVAAMAVVRRFAVAGLDEAACRTGRRRGLAVGAIDETGQVKAGARTAGVKRQYLGCVGKVANGINTVHLAYVREGAGHALIGAREWIPAEHLKDPATSAVMGLPADLVFRTKGQLAIDILAEAFADGVRLDFVCGDEVYGSCTELREFLRRPRPGLRAAGPVQLPPHPGQRGHADLQAGRRAAGPTARLGSPLGRERIQRTTLVCQPHPLPAGPFPRVQPAAIWVPHGSGIAQPRRRCQFSFGPGGVHAADMDAGRLHRDRLSRLPGRPGGQDDPSDQCMVSCYAWNLARHVTR